MLTTETATKYKAPALEKGLDILELLAGHQEGLSQSAIAKALDKSQGEIYRMLSTLVRRGYISHGANNELYTLSLKLFSTAQKHAPIERLLEVARPLMRKAARNVWQSCHLGMESNGSIVIVSSSEAPGNWGFAIRTGSVVGLWNTGTGRVLAAYRNAEELEQLIDHHILAIGEAPLDRDKFLQELKTIRAQGYYKEKSETLIGVTNLSFPVFEPNGQIITVLSCPFIERVDELKTASLAETEAVFAQLARDLTQYFNGAVSG